MGQFLREFFFVQDTIQKQFIIVLKIARAHVFIMVKISKDKLLNVQALLNQKMSYRSISKRTGVSKSEVHRIAVGCGLKSRMKAGRNRILSDRDVTFCITQLSSEKGDSLENLTKIIAKVKGRSVSSRTVSNELHNAGLRAKTKKKKPMISAKNRKERLAFAKSHKDWTLDDWKRVIFSDETKINRFGSDGRVWSWCRDGDPLRPRDVKQTVKHGGGSLMVWGCITSEGVGYLTEIEGIMDQHLYKEIL
jgi:transposase